MSPGNCATYAVYAAQINQYPIRPYFRTSDIVALQPNNSWTCKHGHHFLRNAAAYRGRARLGTMLSKFFGARRIP